MARIAQGTVLNGQYVLDEPLPGDGPGELWRAHHTRYPKTVTIRCGLGAEPAPPEQLWPFLGRAMPGLIGVEEFGSDPSTGGYVITTHGERQPLLPGTLPTVKVLRIVAAIGEALAHLHLENVVHGHVGTAAITVNQYGIFLGGADLVLVGARRDPQGESSPYQSPEEAAGQPLTPRSDVYSLGAVAYELLAGAPPSSGVGWASGRPPAPLPNHVPASVRELVTRALALDPQERWTTASDLATAARLAAGEVYAVPNAVQVAAMPGPARTKIPPARDRLSVSVTCPGLLATDRWSTLVCVLGTAGHKRRVDKVLRGWAPDLNRGDMPSVPPPAVQGRRLTIVPNVPGLTFEPDQVDVTWTGDVQEVLFRVRGGQPAASTSTQPSGVIGLIEVYAYGLLLCTVPLMVSVQAPALWPSSGRPEVSSATTIENIFACFDHSDAAVVEACAAFYRALGVQLHVDHEILSRGTDARTPWQRLIDSCEIFQLYWSSGAHASPFVTQEWRYALSAPHRGTHFVRPVSWESPSPPIPQELQHLPATRLFLDLIAT